MLNINENTTEAYRQKARAQIKEMNTKMEIFEASIEKAGADMKINYQKNLDDWKVRFEEIETKLDNLAGSTGEAWNDIRSGIDASINELQGAIENAKNRLKS